MKTDKLLSRNNTKRETDFYFHVLYNIIKLQYLKENGILQSSEGMTNCRSWVIYLNRPLPATNRSPSRVEQHLQWAETAYSSIPSSMSFMNMGEKRYFLSIQAELSQNTWLFNKEILNTYFRQKENGKAEMQEEIMSNDIGKYVIKARQMMTI